MSGKPRRKKDQKAPRRADRKCDALRRGSLVIIGGREDKEDERVILKRVAELTGGGKLVVVTLASEEPDEQFADYRKVFTGLGVGQVVQLHANSREELMREAVVEIMADARTVFLAGGDQLRLASTLGGTRACELMQEMYDAGGVVAGTSAGASAMSDTMLVSGEGNRSVRLRTTVEMAPGLGLIHTVIIDQHFAERGRIGRLIAAVAENPRHIGIGIDENTAVVTHDDELEVIGEGAVYVLDGNRITHTNVGDGEQKHTLSAFGLSLHLLSQGCRFSVRDHRARPPSRK